MYEPRIESIRKLRVTRLFPMTSMLAYKIEDEVLIFSKSEYFYANKHGHIYVNDISNLPFPRSVLITALESGEIIEEEFNKIREKRGSFAGATDEAVRNFVSESFKADFKKELEEYAIRASAKLTTTGDF